MKIGTIVLTQFQLEPLRANSERRYDPSAIAEARLLLTPSGVLGEWHDGWAVDRHHRDHPANVDHNDLRTLSIGFTAHYQLMADRFGEMELGAGGENLIVAVGNRMTRTDLEGALIVRSQSGDELTLGQAEVAAPCVPFTTFCLSDHNPTAAAITENRAWLDHGMRGFVTPIGGTMQVQTGDELWIA